MSAYSERIAEAVKAKKITFVELSRLTGIPKSALQRYASGETDKLPIDRVALMAKALDTTPAYLMGWVCPNQISSNKVPLPSFTSWADPLVEAYANTVRPKQDAVCAVLGIPHIQPKDEPDPQQITITTYTSSAAAGIPIWVDGESEDKDFPVGVVPNGTNFAIHIAGDSMEPTIENGSYVFVKRQPELFNKEIGVFMLQDEAVCKRFLKDKSGIQLLSDNEKYTPIVITDDTEGFGLVGKVIGHWKP